MPCSVSKCDTLVSCFFPVPPNSQFNHCLQSVTARTNNHDHHSCGWRKWTLWGGFRSATIWIRKPSNHNPNGTIRFENWTDHTSSYRSRLFGSVELVSSRPKTNQNSRRSICAGFSRPFCVRVCCSYFLWPTSFHVQSLQVTIPIRDLMIVNSFCS